MEDWVGRYPFDVYGALVPDDGQHRLRARDADDLALRRQLVHREHPGRLGADDDPRARPRVVRQQRHAVRVERPVVQRGPRELVRVHLRRGERPARGGHGELARRDRLRHARGADGGDLRPRRRVAAGVRAGRPADQRRRRRPLQLPDVPRRRARPVRAAAEDRQPRVRAARARAGPALPRRRAADGRLHRARLARRAARPVRLPARLAVRRDDAADARAPGLDGRSGRGGGDGAGRSRARRRAAALECGYRTPALSPRAPCAC